MLKLRNNSLLAMKSLFEKVCRKAFNEGFYEEKINNPHEAITGIAIGTDWNKYDAEVGIVGFGSHKDRPVTIELWVYSESDLTEISKDFKILVDQFNAVPDTELYAKTGVYEYHFSYMPKAWFSDVWPGIYRSDHVEEKKPVTAVSDKGDIVTATPGSLAEYALSHGCHYMDMTTMTTYRGI